MGDAAVDLAVGASGLGAKQGAKPSRRTETVLD